MLLRAAVTVLNKKQEEQLINNLIGVSMELKMEFDIARYSNNFKCLIENLQDIDFIIMDYAFLEYHKEQLSLFYEKNKKCLPIFMGRPVEKICDYLILRPIGHIMDADHIEPQNKEDKIRQICELIKKNIYQNLDSKADNQTIYITTRQQSYAIPKEKILYCQSDLKYTIFVLDDGRLIRKLDRLLDIKDRYLWDFERIHQSFLVNPKRVAGIEKSCSELVLDENTRIPYSRKYTDVVNDMFKNGYSKAKNEVFS